MGTTLQNGVYLPNEGERNCYAGLKTNWEILDQKVADVTALQQAVAGALHREIVASLPTTDIDPNTIYMILSGTSATENVYNEFMYVNNAWELIGTSATDLTNYYTKGDVDGLLLLKANASDLTSHTGDTTIHVTSADKSKWNTVALIKQLRLVNAQVGSATTIAFANIDDTNGIKVGDKCMDLDGRMFEITAVDTTNQTVTVGTALIDLALDSNVVHTSGNETVGGEKTFTSPIKGYNSDSTQSTVSIDLRTSKVSRGNTSDGVDTFGFGFRDKNNNALASISCVKRSTGGISEYHTVNTTDSSNNVLSESYSFNLSKDGNSTFRPETNDKTLLGTSTNNWKGVYATNYYYGSNNVEFSTKFVTTDTAQTITGQKTFSVTPYIYNSDSTANEPNIIFRNSKYAKGDTTNTGEQRLIFTDSINDHVGQISVNKNSAGSQYLSFKIYTTDNNNATISSTINYYLSKNNDRHFTPYEDNLINLGGFQRRWRNTYTNLVNGLTPSSLSMPVAPSSTSYVDISGYITVLDSSSANTYTPPSNGYITFSVTGNLVQIFHNYGLQGKWTVQAGNDNRGFIPVLGGVEVKIYLTASSVDKFWFIPCQGNI